MSVLHTGTSDSDVILRRGPKHTFQLSVYEKGYLGLLRFPVMKSDQDDGLSQNYITLKYLKMILHEKYFTWKKSIHTYMCKQFNWRGG